MTYAVEYNVAETLKAYTEDLLSTDAQNAALVVAFTDANTDDGGDRIGVMVPSCAGSQEALGNYAAKVEIGIRTATSQPTLEADKLRHFTRVSAVRGGFMVEGLRELIQLSAPDYLGINFVQLQQNFTTRIYDGWMYSQADIDLEVFIKA